MATIKSFTDISQSKTLSKILPLESADGGWYGTNNPLAANTKFWLYTKYTEKAAFPAWSLASLFNILPVIIGDILSENTLRLRIDKGEFDFNIWYESLDTGMVEEGLDIIRNNPVDACYEMILKLHKQNLI